LTVPRLTEPIEVSAQGYPVSPYQSAKAPHGALFDAVVARDFLGLKIRRHQIGDASLNHWIYQAAISEDLDPRKGPFGPFSDIPAWSVSGNEALYLLDFVNNFEIGTTATGLRCSLWISLVHPDQPHAMFEVDGYGEADQDEFGSSEAWIAYQGREIGFGPALGLAISRAVYQATQEMNDVMLDLHHANIRKTLRIPRGA
jgi:hypothetical protein